MGTLTVSEKAKHFSLTGTLEAAAEAPYLGVSAWGECMRNCQRKWVDKGKMEEEALESAHGLATERLHLWKVFSAPFKLGNPGQASL